jgi:medium-chain acyl-[acyl-carrier-protein] hydrolase
MRKAVDMIPGWKSRAGKYRNIYQCFKIASQVKHFGPGSIELPGQMADCMHSLTKSQWLPPRRANVNASIRLFCFPYAGGNESAYRHWQQRLPESIEVLPVLLPGRSTRMKEPPYSELLPLVHAASEALAAETQKPFAFFGHSMGGLIAFELARELHKRHGVQPVHLFISAKCSPRQRSEDPAVGQMADEELIQVLKRYEGTPQELLNNPELMQLFLPIIRADMALCDSYVYEPGPPLKCPITIFGGLKDHMCPRRCLESWQAHTEGTFRLRMLPGGHFFINNWTDSVFEIIEKELNKTSR